MRQHLTIVAVLHLALSAFGAICGFLILGVSMAAGASLGVGQSAGTGWLVGTIGTIVGVMFLALSLPGILFAYGLWTRKPWSRILGFVLSVIHLINIPIGTLIGGYTIWVLMQPETEALLGGSGRVPAF